MSRLVEARERLEAAINRLDRVVTHRLEATETDPEKEELERNLKEAQAECERLRAESRQVSARLGTTIQRFQEILDQE